MKSPASSVPAAWATCIARTRLGRDVALKVLPALNHPHIVTIFSIEDADGAPFMTMELVEGRSLDQALADGALSLARFFDIGVALADALSAAYRKASCIAS